MTRMVVKTLDGTEWPLAIDVTEYRHVMGDTRTARAIRFDLESGNLPSIPRRGRSGERWRIPVAPLLERLGVAYAIGPAGEP